MQRAKRLGLIPPYLFGEIAKMKSKAIAEGRDLIDLGIGDPDQPTPTNIIDKLTEFSHDPSTHRYDESNMGPAEFLTDVATWFQGRFGVTLDPSCEILELIGSKEGLAHAAWAFIDPGMLRWFLTRHIRLSKSTRSWPAVLRMSFLCLRRIISCPISSPFLATWLRRPKFST